MTTTAKIGAFFVVVLLALGVLILKIEDIHFGKKARTISVDAHFKDVAGLDDKSAVRIAGVRVGKVDGISLRPDGTALAHLALDPNVELHQGAIAQVRSLGMLGDKYVELTPGRPGGPAPPERSPPRGELRERDSTTSRSSPPTSERTSRRSRARWRARSAARRARTS